MSVLRPFELEAVRVLVHAETSVVIEPDKGYLVESRLLPLMRAHRKDSVAELLAELSNPSQAGLRRAIAQSLVNGETSFFRDAAVFNMLSAQLLPKLMAARAATRRLVIWSAACSTGQEPYSLAMLLFELFPQLTEWNVEIWATDFSEEHLAKARAGRYTQYEVNRGLPAAMLVRWFEKQSDEWVVDAALRKCIRFAPINLVTGRPPACPVDLLLLRNVMIYWKLATQRSMLARVRELLAPDGALVLGAAESTLHIDERFERVAAAGASYFVPRSG